MPRHSSYSPEQITSDFRRNVGFFSPNPYIRLGDADSAHAVMFGETPEYGSVAIKPFTKLQRAQREAHALTEMQTRGFEVLEPLDVVRGGVFSYLITRYRRGLRHLGQMPWHVNVADPQLHRVIDPVLSNTAERIAEWHAAGVVRKDLQAKNVAFDQRTGESVVIDAEKTLFDLPVGDHTREANKDLTLLGTSILARGLLDDRSASYRAGYLGDQLLDPYLEAVSDAGFSMPPEQRKAAIEDFWVGKMDSAYTPHWVAASLGDSALVLASAKTS